MVLSSTQWGCEFLLVLLASPLIDSVIRSTPSPSEGICGRSLFISAHGLSVGAPPQMEWWTSGGSSGARRREEVQESPLHWDRYRGGDVFLSLSGNPQQSVREERGTTSQPPLTLMTRPPPLLLIWGILLMLHVSLSCFLGVLMRMNVDGTLCGR